MTASGTALITGASSGIGAAYADRLARRGHPLILVARDAERLRTLAERLRVEAGTDVEVMPADLTDHAALVRVEERLRTDSSIAMLVNNAGATMRSAFVGTSPDDVAALVGLNVTAAARLATVAADAFAKRGSGTIVNVSSMVAIAPEKFRGVYGATKAFILNLSLSLNAEVAPLGVRVQVLVPGATRTEIAARAGKIMDAALANTLMEPDEFVDAALAGLDRGEAVTMPSLQRTELWDALTTARLQLLPELSRSRPADRYAVVP